MRIKLCGDRDVCGLVGGGGVGGADGGGVKFVRIGVCKDRGVWIRCVLIFAC